MYTIKVILESKALWYFYSKTIHHKFKNVNNFSEKIRSACTFYIRLWSIKGAYYDNMTAMAV